jgi:hypothetical protein
VAVNVAVKPVTAARFVSNTFRFVTLKPADAGNVPKAMLQIIVVNSPAVKPDDLMTERISGAFMDKERTGGKLE